MFTGIIQDIGTVKEAGRRLVVVADLPYDPPLGGSVAVDGVCLTRVDGPGLEFDLSDETLARTTLGSIELGTRVNVEAALRAGDPIGGHFVAGHVDGVGEFLGADGEEFRFRAPEGAEQYLVDKGSVALAGISLTVVRPLGLEFSVALVPHTLAATTLGFLTPGDQVNVEYDVLARYARGEQKTAGG